MKQIQTDLKYKAITEKILRAFYNVYNELGFGFLEKVYERAMLIELKQLGLNCESQKRIDVFYKSINIGDYYADIIVEDKVIIELKVASGISNEHIAQLLNYLKATNIEIGLLLNFGNKPQFKRMIFENKFKKINRF